MSAANYPPANEPAATGPRYVRVRAPRLTPWITYTLMGVTILVYVLQLASQFILNGVDYPAAIGMKVNEAILVGQLWRLITPVFLHSTSSLLHIGYWESIHTSRCRRS